jgi:hypothetical protein
VSFPFVFHAASADAGEPQVASTNRRVDDFLQGPRIASLPSCEEAMREAGCKKKPGAALPFRAGH